jgi:hypothetical protein
VNATRLCGLAASLSLLLISHAYADGKYQWTEDRKKALVWNNDPKPGDTATWSGKHDDEGYAAGPGKLTWTRVNRGFATGSNVATTRRSTPISSYTGTMEHGKFSGGVMTVDHGKTYHANFVDGQRKGIWARGPLITKAESAETKKTEAAAPEGSTSVASQAEGTEKVASEKSETSKAEQTTADVPAAGPEEETSKASSANQPSAPLIAQTSVDEPDQSATPREPVTRKGALAPGAVRAIEKPAGASAKKSEAVPIKRAERAKPEKSEKPARPAASQPAELQTDVSEQSPEEGPTAEATPEKLQPPKLKSERPPSENPKPSAKETPLDDSIRSLVGPPSSLRSNPPAATNPPTQVSTPATAAASPPPPSAAKLTAVQAMDIADIEARTRGYDLGEYQLPKAEYNASNDTWSVAYAARDSNNAAKKLSVTIQDKTGKAEVKK